MNNPPSRETPHYKKVVQWTKDYGSSGLPDQRALQDFIECETDESIKALKNELIGISQGNYRDDIFDKLIGVNRRLRHSSYTEWSKLMLIWLATYNKKS